MASTCGMCIVLAVAWASSAVAQLQPSMSSSNRGRKLFLAEVTPQLQHITNPCDPATLGSWAGCFNHSIKSKGNNDFPWGSPQISYPIDGFPWGIHLTGPYPDGTTYLVSWFSGQPTVGPASSLQGHEQEAPLQLAFVQLSTEPGKVPSHGTGNGVLRYRGSVITYTRIYDKEDDAKFSYRSPNISHVVLRGLRPSTTYYYSVGKGRRRWSQEMNFTTLPASSSPTVYPLRIGLVGDIGQSINSTITRDRLSALQPNVLIMVGDNSYADEYSPSSLNLYHDNSPSNQNRWDSYAVMWQPLFAHVPVLNCAGNHEMEDIGIPAKIDYKTTHFSYPEKYPFQSYAARYPVPGVVSDFGNIDNSLFYSTTLAGKVKLITMNNYVPFHDGTPQYKWALQEFEKFSRNITPWLIVQFHAAPYHTYASHFKEMECFMSIWEDIFYMYGVDFVLSGHVHGYERTHSVFQYEQDDCAPMYVTLGSGGNAEGPQRNFVDEINPFTKLTYCQELRSEDKLTPLQVHASAENISRWGPYYQIQVHPPGCITTTWQAAQGVKGGPPLLQLEGATDENGVPVTVGFCQSSQPLWSAFRDPSFGYGLLEIVDDNSAEISWYRTTDPAGAPPVDKVLLGRKDECADLTPHMRMQNMHHHHHRRHTGSG